MTNDAKKELERRKNSFKILKRILFVIDIIAVILFIIQLIFKDIVYYSYVILVICNILTFVLSPKEKKSRNEVI